MGRLRNQALRILALTKYGDAAASTRQRFLLYRPALEKAGFELAVSPLLSNQHVRGLASGHRANPASVALSYARRLGVLITQAHDATVLWVHCELFPYLPGVFERLAFRPGRPVVFDYDDAIFHMYDSLPLLRSKLRPLIAGSAAVSAGNEYLADYARRLNGNVHVVPTVVDTDCYVPEQGRQSGAPVIGWIGSPSTWPYVRQILPIVEELCRGGRARFLVIGAGKQAEADRFPGMELREWTERSEVADVQSMDIGIMPLSDDRWARGKSGYKLVQYMACGLPVIASPVGVNTEMVGEGLNGFLASTADQWRHALYRLTEDSDLRSRMGMEGRKVAISDYSLAAHAPRIVGIMRDCLGSS